MTEMNTSQESSILSTLRHVSELLDGIGRLTATESSPLATVSLDPALSAGPPAVIMWHHMVAMEFALNPGFLAGDDSCFGAAGREFFVPAAPWTRFTRGVMEQNVWLVASGWMALALIASLISIRIGISVALIEILVGVFAGNFLGLHTTAWIDFLAMFGAVLLTFLAGAEIDPDSLRRHLKPALVIAT